MFEEQTLSNDKNTTDSVVSSKVDKRTKAEKAYQKAREKRVRIDDHIIYTTNCVLIQKKFSKGLGILFIFDQKRQMLLLFSCSSYFSNV